MTPAPKQPGYGYVPNYAELAKAQDESGLSRSGSPDYPQYPQPTAPYNPQPFDINALLRLLGGTTPQPSTGGGGTSKGGEPVGTYKPGFLGMPMPSSPQAPLPDMSTILPALPPQMPGGSMEDPYSTSTSRDFGFIGGKPPVAPQAPQMGGTNVGQLIEALRAMQGRTTAPQAPLVPERTMPIQYSDVQRPPKVDFNGPMTDEQRYKMLENFMIEPPGQVPQMSPTESAMNRALRLARESERLRLMGGAPRMPSPTPVPQSEMGGRSGMGLGGILNAIRASRQR